MPAHLLVVETGKTLQLFAARCGTWADRPKSKSLEVSLAVKSSVTLQAP